MAKIMLDDVLLSAKNKKVEADETMEVVIPKICSRTGSQKKISLDISEEGREYFQKHIQPKYEEALMAAGDVLAKLSDDFEAYLEKGKEVAAKKKAKEEKAAATEQVDTTEAPAEQATWNQ